MNILQITPGRQDHRSLRADHLSIAFTAISMPVSFVLFAVGAPLHLGFPLFVLSRWIGQSYFEVHHSNPSWFIPVVGNILVPIVGVEHGQTEISWFFFSVGFVFWLVLQTIIFNRVIFHHPLPEKMIPALFILIAPPAVGFIAYVKLTGGVDNFARLLYYFALFIVLLLIALYRQFCSIQYYLFQWLSWGLLALLVGTIFMLALKTLREVVNGRICVEE